MSAVIKYPFHINGIKLAGRNGGISSQDDVDLLYKYASFGNSYIEIGVFFGSSLVIAGLACDGELHGIDPFDGMNKPGRPDDVTGLIPSVDHVITNIDRFGIDRDRVHLHVQRHPPWPEAIKDKKFDVGLIDGLHTYDACLADWQAMKEHVTKYILFHDYGRHGTVRQVVTIACESWNLIDQADDMVVLSRE